MPIFQVPGPPSEAEGSPRISWAPRWQFLLSETQKVLFEFQSRVVAGGALVFGVQEAGIAKETGIKRRDKRHIDVERAIVDMLREK